MLVCGTGESLLTIPRKPPIPSIGVNDCHQWVETDYLVVMGDPGRDFTPERRLVITESDPSAIFMLKKDKRVWNRYWGERILNGYPIVPTSSSTISFEDESPWGQPIRKGAIYSIPSTSPGTALGLALYMGATRIGLIGVDLTNHTGLSGQIDSLNERFAMMCGVAAVYGARIFNLSPRSALAAFPHITYQDWLALDESAQQRS